MKIGLKRRRVAIERATKSQTSSGAISKAWSVVGHAWASIDPIRGEERVQAMQLQAVVTHTIRMRMTGIAATLTAVDRITYRGRQFIISSVINIGERDRELEILATETAA